MQLSQSEGGRRADCQTLPQEYHEQFSTSTGADQIIQYLVLMLHNQREVCQSRWSGASHIYKVISSSHLNPPHTPHAHSTPHPPLPHCTAQPPTSYFLPACLLSTYTYYSRYIYYTSPTSQAGCSHDFLVPNNDARWPELPDNVALIYVINEDIFQYSRPFALIFYALLVFSFTTQIFLIC